MDENHINFFISENLRKIKLADYKKFYLGTFANDEIFSFVVWRGALVG